MKRMIFRIILISAIVMLTTVSPALCATISSGPYFFSESDSWVNFPKFDHGLGALNSVTFTMSDVAFSERMILDVDDNKGPFNAVDLSRSIQFGFRALNNHIFSGGMFQVNSPKLSGTSVSGDDGDGEGPRDGGFGEIIWDLPYPVSGGSITFTELQIMDFFIGTGHNSMLVGPTISFTTLPITGRVFEVYEVDQMYSGSFLAEYDFTPVPYWVLSGLSAQG